MFMTNELPSEIAFEVPLRDTDSDALGSFKEHKEKRKFGAFGNDLKFAYKWLQEDGHLIGYDSATGITFGEYTFGGNLKEDASIEAVVEFQNDSTLACCAVTYRNRSLLCCVDLSLSKVMHSIKVKKHPLTTLNVIMHGSAFSKFTHKLHPLLRATSGLVAAGQIGGKVLLIDMQANNSNWWRHEEFNPTNLNMIPAKKCDDPTIVQNANSHSAKGEHLAVVLDSNFDSSVEVTCMQFCQEPMILIVGFSTGHFDIWSLTSISKLYSGEPTGSRISHIMSMLPEDDPRKWIYVWVVEDGTAGDSLVGDRNIVASAYLHSLVFKSSDQSPSDYEVLDKVNCMFRVLFDKVGDSYEGDEYTTNCVSVSPISIDINDQYLSTLNCTGLCSFVWTEYDVRTKSHPKYLSAIFDLGRWYAEEMPKQAFISDLETASSSYLAYSQLDIGRSYLLEAKVCSRGTKKNIWQLNEEVTSYAASTSFSMLMMTSENIVRVDFPGIQSYLFDKVDEMKPWELMEPHNLFTKCLVAGLMPEGMYDAKKIYSKVKMVEAIYEVAVNHNLLSFLRRCATEFFDGKYESADLSTQHLIEWAWNKAKDVKVKSDDLVTLLYSGQELTQSDKNSHNQYVNDLQTITKLFTHVKRENLLHSPEAMEGLSLRIKGLNLVNEYLNCVQYFCTCRLLPDSAESGLRRLDLLKNEYNLRRLKDGEHLVDLLVERFGDELKDLWTSLGGDGKYPPPSMHSILSVLLLDEPHIRDKHCLMLYFLFDITKASRMNESLAVGYKEMISSSDCSEQIVTSQFLWAIDHGNLNDALKCLGSEKLDSSWNETVFAHLQSKCSAKEIYNVYRSIGFETDTMDKKKFVTSLFLENNLVIPCFKWIRATNAGVFDPECYAFFLKRTHQVGALEKLVAKELLLNPQEFSMLRYYLQKHKLHNLMAQLEEKIGKANFVPFPVVSSRIYNDEIMDYRQPEIFIRERCQPIKSDEVQEFLKSSFKITKYTSSTPTHAHVLHHVAGPSILKNSDSPAGSPLHLSSVVSPSPKRLRFQLPKPISTSNQGELSASSTESSPVTEDVVQFEFQSPRASTPKSTHGAASEEPEQEFERNEVFEFSNPSPVIYHLLERTNEAEILGSPISKSSSSICGNVSYNVNDFAVELDPNDASTPREEEEEILTVETTEKPTPKFGAVLLEDSVDSLFEEAHSSVTSAYATETETCTPLIQRIAPFVGTTQKRHNLNNIATNIVTSTYVTETETCTPLIQRIAPFVGTTQKRHNLNNIATNILAEPMNTMEISEDEDDKPLECQIDDDIKTSPISPLNTSNDSFYSVSAGPQSPNSTVLSFTSCLDETITVDEEEGEYCPITKRRQSTIGERSLVMPREVDDLNEEDLSPSKFWQPPPLPPIPKAEPSTSSCVDLSSLPKPPQRPSPRRPLRSYLKLADEGSNISGIETLLPTTPEKSIDAGAAKVSLSAMEVKESPDQITPEQEKEDDKSVMKDEIEDPGPGETSELTDFTEISAPADKLVDSVFFRTIDTTFESEMREWESEHEAKTTARKISTVEFDEDDSEDDVTLDKTVILSSGGSGDSPLKRGRMSVSPKKRIREDTSVKIKCEETTTISVIESAYSTTTTTEVVSKSDINIEIAVKEHQVLPTKSDESLPSNDVNIENQSPLVPKVEEFSNPELEEVNYNSEPIEVAEEGVIEMNILETETSEAVQENQEEDIIPHDKESEPIITEPDEAIDEPLQEGQVEEVHEPEKESPSTPSPEIVEAETLAVPMVVQEEPPAVHEEIQGEPPVVHEEIQEEPPAVLEITQEEPVAVLEVTPAEPPAIQGEPPVINEEIREEPPVIQEEPPDVFEVIQEELTTTIEEVQKEPPAAPEVSEPPKRELRRRHNNPSYLEVPEAPKRKRTPSPMTSSIEEAKTPEKPEPAKKAKTKPTPRSKLLGEKIEEQLNKFVATSEQSKSKVVRKAQPIEEKPEKPQKAATTNKGVHDKPPAEAKPPVHRKQKTAVAKAAEKPGPKSEKLRRIAVAGSKQSETEVRKVDSKSIKVEPREVITKHQKTAKEVEETPLSVLAAKPKAATKKTQPSPSKESKTKAAKAKLKQPSQESELQSSQESTSSRRPVRLRKIESSETSSQESQSPTRHGRGRPRKLATVTPGPSGDMPAIEETPLAARNLRHRSKSAVIDTVPATTRQLRTRSSSVVSDKSTSSQASTQSRKRKVDSDSDGESTTSEASLRRSGRNRKAAEKKRGRKVSMIPE
ncbi:protein ELYS-like isoform X2 [Neocloeon triangulifer]|uniref:protein ELYS-like isoform X2 n=1 Tax=Neocloeon triangulifer TaxID=2078957 RepID=UPI00286F1631|nr:protein ELYS-like isoform X2 [Neocloeon triangulifer]